MRSAVPTTYRAGETPRETSLYREIAKDYQPKQAEMKICKYIEGLEARIAALERLIEPVLCDPEQPPARTGRRKTAPLEEQAAPLGCQE